MVEEVVDRVLIEELSGRKTEEKRIPPEEIKDFVEKYTRKRRKEMLQM